MFPGTPATHIIVCSLLVAGILVASTGLVCYRSRGIDLRELKVISYRSFANAEAMTGQEAQVPTITACRHAQPGIADAALNRSLSLIPNNMEKLLLGYDSRSWVQLAPLMAHIQGNPKCDTAQYLLVDDISTVSGMGWSMLTIIPLALQAFVQRRVLVHASSIIPGVTWAWCGQPPYSVDCYFCAWTPCLDYLRSLNLTMTDLQQAPSWDQTDEAATKARFLAFRNMHIPNATTHQINEMRSGPFNNAEPFFASGSLRASRFFWYGLAMQEHFRPNQQVENEAIEFLVQHGLAFGERFIVAHLRHGSKGVEQRPVPPEEYVKPLQQMMECLKTRHVFVVTETAAAAMEMQKLAQQHNFHSFTINYTYPDVDSWNTEINPNVTADMKVIGYVSALALAITRRGSAFIGTLQSAWAKVSVSHMYGFHGRPVPAVSLAHGWASENSYRGEDNQYWTFNPTQQNWQCV